MRISYSAITFLSFVLMICFPAYSCRFQKSLTQAQMDKADVIFIGHASTIGVPTCSGSSCAGKMKAGRTIIFDIEKIIEGKDIGKSVEVYWLNGMFGEVDDVLAFRKKYGDHNKVGIIFPETIRAHLHCASQQGISGTGKPVTTTACSLGLPLPFDPQPNSEFDRPWIISDVCSEAFIQNLAN